MSNLSSLRTLQDYQEYVRTMYRERGFDKQRIEELFHFMLEEVGEFARAARKHAKVGGYKRVGKLEHEDYALEAGDVFIYLLGISKALKIDLEQGFREKEEVNRERKYQGCEHALEIPALPSSPVLKDYQQYVQRAFEMRGNSDLDISFLFLWFLEELGEFAGGVRESHKTEQVEDSHLAWKAADVFIFLLQLCTVLDVDLTTSFVEKETINSERSWK